LSDIEKEKAMSKASSPSTPERMKPSSLLPLFLLSARAFNRVCARMPSSWPASIKSSRPMTITANGQFQIAFIEPPADRGEGAPSAKAAPPQKRIAG